MTECLLDIMNASGTKRKLSLVAKYKEDETFRRLLYYTLNPMLTYRMSERMFAEPPERAPNVLFSDFFECCEYLSGLRGIDDATIRQVNNLLWFSYDEYDREVMKKILSKTLRLGVTAESVCKVLQGLIPVWSVQQAYTIEKYPPDGSKEFWLTQKLNGVRATYYNGQLIARSGAVYEGLSHITDEIYSHFADNMVLDGELTLLDNGGLSDNEAFRKATGIINSDGVDKTSICFTVFDMISRKDFEKSRPEVSYSLRRGVMEAVRNDLVRSKYIRILPVLYHGSDIAMIDKLLDRMVAEDKEGLMLNYDVPYRKTRHNGILKIKRFYTMDLPIIRCEEGTGRLAGTLGAVVVRYKNSEVGVGTGFTDEQRAIMWSFKDDLEGVLCEVKYKEVSYDKKTGEESLQFPVFISIRMDKTEENYE